MSDEQSTPPLKSRRNLDWFMVLLTWYILSGFMSVMLALFLKEVPAGNKEVLIYMAGQLSGFAGAMVAVWSTTTHESSKKSDVIAQAQPVKL